MEPGMTEVDRPPDYALVMDSWCAWKMTLAREEFERRWRTGREELWREIMDFVALEEILTRAPADEQWIGTPVEPPQQTSVLPWGWN